MSTGVGGPCGDWLLADVVGGFERFLVAEKGVAVATRECYARHVRAFLQGMADLEGRVYLPTVSAAT